MQASPPAGLIQVQGESQFQQSGASECSRLAPVQPGMRQENGGAADDKSKKDAGVDPMCDADKNVVRLCVFVSLCPCVYNHGCFSGQYHRYNSGCDDRLA